MDRLILLFNTIKYLKRRQVYYRLFYYIRLRWRKIIGFRYPLILLSQHKSLKLEESIKTLVSVKHKSYTFLNLSHSFEDKTDWNYSKYGKLWTYNLAYFDYLHQKEITKDDGIKLIVGFIDQLEEIKDGLEPFPISLRGINWIKFLVNNKIDDKKINDSLYAQYMILHDNIEYHLLGNHLLENGFSLLFGAYYFQDEKLYAKAKKILTDELEEQILKDGAHFELSPMYHQIMLFRVLDCINLLQNNNWKKQEMLALLIVKAGIMVGWLDVITYKNGDIPLLNDSANNIAPSTEELNEYMKRLKVKMKKLVLSTSGYRKIENQNYEMVVDVGNIGPDYIPGHAHSDTFNFELYIDGKPFIVDTGLSTYEKNERRTLERSTSSHNTVEIDGIDQSEVWGGFRVANRAYVVDIEERDSYIKAIHNGYKRRIGALHQREFIFDDKNIKIIDTVVSEKEHAAIARLHFYPGFKPTIIEDGIQINDFKIKIQNSKFKIKEYSYAPEFNILKNAKMLEIQFIKKLEIEIIL